MIKAKYDVTRPVNLPSVEDVNKWTQATRTLSYTILSTPTCFLCFLLCDSLVASEHHTSL